MRNLRGALRDSATPSKNVHKILQGHEIYNTTLVEVKRRRWYSYENNWNSNNNNEKNKKNRKVKSLNWNAVNERSKY